MDHLLSNDFNSRDRNKNKYIFNHMASEYWHQKEPLACGEFKWFNEKLIQLLWETVYLAIMLQAFLHIAEGK